MPSANESCWSSAVGLATSLTAHPYRRAASTGTASLTSSDTQFVRWQRRPCVHLKRLVVRFHRHLPPVRAMAAAAAAKKKRNAWLYASIGTVYVYREQYMYICVGEQYLWYSTYQQKWRQRVANVLLMYSTYQKNGVNHVASVHATVYVYREQSM